MKFRIYFSLVLISLCFSCEKFGGIKQSKSLTTGIDTIIDYSKVDVLPSFSICDSILEISQKNRCFINSLYTHFSSDLLAHTFDVSMDIDEMVSVKLEISKNGNASLVSIESSDQVKKMIPQLNDVILESVKKLPTLYPALKQGIPVTTVYELPIVIKLK